MKVVFAGGGTGGHLYPAIAIAQALPAGSAATFIGTADRLESTIVPKAGFPLKTIAAAPLARSLSFKSVRAPFVNLAGIVQSARALNELHPDIVVATGGYVCFPAVVAAKLQRIPVAMLEPNARAGLTSKLVAPLVDEVWGPYDNPDSRWKKIYVRTGVPVRASLRPLPPRNEAAQRLQLDPSKRTLLVMGGSQGARSINVAVRDWLTSAPDIAGWQVVVVAGSANAAELREALERRTTPVLVVDYLADPADAFALADLALVRAGASTLAELAAVGLPAILVPYPYATGDHQAANARAVEQSGAAVVLADRDLNGERLAAVFAACSAPERLDEMRYAASARVGEDAAATIVARMNALVSRRPTTT